MKALVVALVLLVGVVLSPLRAAATTTPVLIAYDGPSDLRL
jgi:hypothetical protein